MARDRRGNRRTGAGGGIPPEAAGVAVLAVHNLAVHRLLPAPADAALNLLTAAGLTGFARRSGCSRAELGIRAEDAGRGLRWGLGAAAVAAALVGGGAALPATRPFFADRRLAGVGRGEAAYHLTLRIPLTTALAEELLFRGVLLALFRRRYPSPAAVAWTSALFGAWHVLPTLDHYRGNPASDLVTDAGRGRRLAVLSTAASTAAVGTGFAWLRLRSGSVLAPTLAHAAVNLSAYVAGLRAVRGSNGRTRPSCQAARARR